MEQELQIASADTLATLNKSEIDQQIATAHQFPRSLKSFLNEARQLVTLSELVAGECVYSLPRGGKNIEGPSARFAEIMVHSWGNCRVGARVISEDANFVTAQGVFHDLEKNSAITYEVKRRITDKNGNRFKADMIGVTSNAACSIALRNAALKGIPKALWNEMYEEARHVIMGDIKTLSNRRAEMMSYLVRYGVTPDVAFQVLEVQGEEDITLNHMVTLRGLANALKTGETTLERILAELNKSDDKENGSISNGNGKTKTAGLKDKLKPAGKPTEKAGEKVNTETGEVTGGDSEDAGPSLQEVSGLIDRSASPADLDTAFGMISILPKKDQAAARKLATAKRAELEG